MGRLDLNDVNVSKNFPMLIENVVGQDFEEWYENNKNKLRNFDIKKLNRYQSCEPDPHSSSIL